MILSRPKGGLLVVGLGLLAANCGGDSGGDVMPSDDPDAVTLLDVQAQVFSPRCALSGCHIGAAAPMGLDLSAAAARGNLVGVASAELPALLRVERFNAADSYLYMKLTADPGILGDPMPLTGGALGQGDLGLIEDWIEQGAP